ncbi:chaperone modulator CbpM [Thermodesulfobacteriota bacterium]
MMKKEYWTLEEVVETIEIDEVLLSELEEEGIVCPTCHANESSKSFSRIEVEKVRIAKQLIEEMDVNPPGVDIILRMRQNMIDMRKQFDSILEDLARQMKKRFDQNNI